MMYEYLDQTLPKRVLDQIVNECLGVLRSEMFYFPPFVRYLILAHLFTEMRKLLRR